jgi:Fructosamine kinase
VTLPPGAHDATRVGGGDINEAFRVVLADGGEAFVKTRADADPGEYAAEAAGLEWLAQPGALRTPRVLAVDARYLALQWIEAARRAPLLGVGPGSRVSRLANAVPPWLYGGRWRGLGRTPARHCLPAGSEEEVCVRRRPRPAGVFTC